MYARFNTVAVQTMRLSNQAAWHLRHDYISSEHILIGLVGNRRCPGEQLLARHGASRSSVIHELRSRVVVGRDPVDKGRRRVTEEARRVIESSALHSDKLGQHFIATEHLLLGLLAVESGIAARALAALDIGYDDTFRSIASGFGVSMGVTQEP